jgi:hypothetical protein
VSKSKRDTSNLHSEDGEWSTCEACGKFTLPGHVVVLYDDVGAVHVDCDHPYKLLARAQVDVKPKRYATAYVLAGDPMMLYRASALLRQYKGRGA